MTDLLSRLTDRNKLEELLAEHRGSGKSRSIVEAEMAGALKARVKGQDHVTDDVCRVIRLQWGKRERKRPIANLLFLGPTGTGKTELAKAMAEYLFESEKAMVRFDCSEFTGAEAKSRLIGVPTGYVGASAGGQLTRPLLADPKRLVLFDEIEKAYRDVFDLFLQMLGDGRLTEQGSGKVADFTQSIIVLTSNAESDAIVKIDEDVSDYHDKINAVKGHLADTGVFRPEIIGRIDRVYVFKSLEGMVIAEIAALKMMNLATEFGLELTYADPQLIFDAMEKGNRLSRFGVRELDRVINEMLAEPMLLAQEAGSTTIRLETDEGGELLIRSDTEPLDVSVDTSGS